MAARFEVLKDDDGKFWFRLKAANGEVVAQSQTYTTVADTLTGMAAVQAAAAEATLPADDRELDIEDGIHMHY